MKALGLDMCDSRVADPARLRVLDGLSLPKQRVQSATNETTTMTE